MRALELLIEDYEKRLKTINSELSKIGNGDVLNRLKIKASEYKKFIAELKRVLADVASTDSKLNLADVVLSF